MKTWKKLHQRELLFECIMCGLIVAIGGGLLVFVILKTADKPSIFSGDIRLVIFVAVSIFVLIALSVISIYGTATSHIHWHKEIFHAIPFPVIVIGRDADWQQMNTAAREINPKQIGGLRELAGKHLTDADSSAVKKAIKHNGLEYQIIIKHFRYGGKEPGFLIAMGNPQQSDLYESVIAILCDSANILAGHSSLQTELIDKLAAVIAGIASGELNGVGLHKQMTDIQLEMEKGQTNLDEVIQNAKKLNAACTDMIHFREK